MYCNRFHKKLNTGTKTMAKTEKKTAEKKSAPVQKAGEKPAGKKEAKTKAAPVVKLSEPTHDQIAAKAYEIYLSRDPHAGDETSDWMKAVADLTGASSKKKK